MPLRYSIASRMVLLGIVPRCSEHPPTMSRRSTTATRLRIFAIAAAKMRKRVAVVDRRDMVGGCSLHLGTIPSKTMREAMLYLSGMRQRTFYGADYREKEDISARDLSQRVDVV